MGNEGLIVDDEQLSEMERRAAIIRRAIQLAKSIDDRSVSWYHIVAPDFLAPSVRIDNGVTVNVDGDVTQAAGKIEQGDCAVGKTMRTSPDTK